MGTERTITIDRNHPSIAGHFPGHPVVPGVVMLGEVMNAIREMIKENIEFVGMPSAKFMSPLNPGEPFMVKLDQESGAAVAFTCTVGSRLIASGCLRYRVIEDDPPGDS